MTDTERKAAEAERLMAEIAPYLDAVEKQSFEALLVETEAEKILEHRHFINASRKFRAELKTAIVLGSQAARKAPTVA
jgi:hypothetical protein